jgi:hypothetical protein
MKKIPSKKKLQLRSSTIAYLAGPDLRIAQGGTNDGVGTTDGAGITSRVDNDNRVVCVTHRTDGLQCASQDTTPQGQG